MCPLPDISYVTLFPPKVTVLQGENALLESRGASLKSVEQEKQVLEQKVKSLEKAAAESKANANIITNIDTTGDPILAKFKEEKEAADGQVCLTLKLQL